jgi:hypothetical protein
MMIKLLRGYNNKHLNTWNMKLVCVQHSYTRELHSSTNKSHFDTRFGYLPPFPVDIVYGKYKDETRLQGDEEKVSTLMEKIR